MTNITLNIGSKLFSVSKEILIKESTYFESLFKENFKIDRDSDGNVFIDRDGIYFEYIIEYFKNKTMSLNNDLNYEDVLSLVKFFGMENLIVYMELDMELLDKYKNYRKFYNFLKDQGETEHFVKIIKIMKEYQVLDESILDLLIETDVCDLYRNTPIFPRVLFRKLTLMYIKDCTN